MKGSLMATTSTFLEQKAARVTRRPMRPNLKCKKIKLQVYPSLASRWWYDTMTLWPNLLDDLITVTVILPDAEVWSLKISRYMKLVLTLASVRLPLHYCSRLSLCVGNIEPPGDQRAQLKKGQGSGGGALGGMRFSACSWSALTHSTLGG